MLHCSPKIGRLWLISLMLLLLGGNTLAETPLLVQKQRFALAQFKLQNGQTIAPVQVGWEAYGKLNADKSNVILITHYFTGSSHAAGKYRTDDTAPGYWDAIIGPGKAIDTNLFYVISVDTLVNANAKDPNVITTGPASINPKTGKRWGLTFPVVTITDFVEVQKALLDSLGIQRFHAVIGPSMGSFQAIEWATRYPERVQRLIPVIGAAFVDTYTALKLERWADPIKQDPNWQQGNYYDQPRQPTAGLTQALSYITLDALNPAGVNLQYPPISQDQAAHQHILASFSALEQLQQRAATRAALVDANHVLYLVRASQLWRAGMQQNWSQQLSRIQAKVLFLPASGDLLLTQDTALQSQQQLLQHGKSAQLLPIAGQNGHLDGLLNILSVGPQIQQFLTTPL